MSPQLVTLAVTFMLLLPIVSVAQSIETFSAIRLEDQTTGNTVTLSPPTLTTSYSLTLPASIPASGPTSVALIYNRLTSSASFQSVPSLNLSAQQIGYLDQDGSTIRGSSGLVWDTTAAELRLTAGAGRVLNVTRATASTAPIATFNGGSVGIGTTTPTARLEVNGDFAIRELNYTTTITAASNNNFDFGNNNEASFVRLGPQSAARSFTGFVGGKNGKKLEILNASGQAITFRNQSTSSVDTTRIQTTDDGDLLIPNRATVGLTYSGAEQRWRVTSLSPLIVQAFTDFADVVASGDTQIPANSASYIKVTNNSGNRDVTVPDGLTIGQILVVQNLGPDRITITGSNVTIQSPSDKLDAGDAGFFVWDGADWQLIARKQ